MKNLMPLLFCLLAAPLSAAQSVLVLPNFRSVAREVRPAVVNLSVVKDVQSTDLSPLMDQFFGNFFDQPGGRQQRPWFRQRSLGSGVIVDAKDGYILTNNHVIEGADGITVKLADKREFAGTVVGRDPKTDLAVVRIKGAKGLTALPFGDSDKIEVGDWVLAVGSPFGLEQTVSHGIISAKGRVIGDGPYDDFLQTDAPINPGNSGGPLVDLSGDIIGINTAISTQSGGSEGIGFAIPSNMARAIYRQLVSKGKITRGWLGISIQDLGPALDSRFGLPQDAQGALVADVMAKGPARAAGLRSGDVIQAFNGRAVTDARTLQLLVADAPVGRTAVLRVWRDDAPLTLRVKVGDMARYNGDGGGGPSAGDAETTSAPSLGLTVRSLDEKEARKNPHGGVVVSQVEGGSAADQAGVQPGDILLELGRSRVDSPARLSGLVKRLRAGHAVVIRVKRDGRSLYLVLKVPAAEH